MPSPWLRAAALLVGAAACASEAPRLVVQGAGPGDKVPGTAAQDPAQQDPPQQEPGQQDQGGAAPEPAPQAEPPRPAPAPSSEPGALRPAGPAPEGGSGVPVHGMVLSRFVGRATHDATDLDLLTTIALDVGDPERHPVTAHVLGRVDFDLGGHDPNDTFFSLDDTTGASVDGVLYEAYVDAHGVDSLGLLRVGRQEIWDTPVFVVLDGVRVETLPISGVEVGGFAGVRTQYWDRSAPTDAVAGVYGSARPWKGGRVRLDYLYLEDEDRLGTGQDDLFGAGVWQNVGEDLSLEADYTRLEGKNRDVRVRAHYLDPETELSLQASYYSLLTTQGQHALEGDPYFSTLMELRPYHEVGLLASKGFHERVDLGLGVDLRFLDRESDVGEFNHEFQRYFANVVVSDAFVHGLAVTLTGEVWNDDQQDVSTWGLDLTQRLSEALEGSLGSYYSLYKYDLFLSSERDDVRTYYTKLCWKPPGPMSFDVEYDYENDDLQDYHRLLLGARWLF